MKLAEKYRDIVIFNNLDNKEYLSILDKIREATGNNKLYLKIKVSDTRLMAALLELEGFKTTFVTSGYGDYNSLDIRW